MICQISVLLWCINPMQHTVFYRLMFVAAVNMLKSHYSSTLNWKLIRLKDDIAFWINPVFWFLDTFLQSLQCSVQFVILYQAFMYNFTLNSAPPFFGNTKIIVIAMICSYDGRLERVFWEIKLVIFWWLLTVPEHFSSL